jgi:feruloyl esterase
MYGERPRFNYYFGQSQGGREGLMVAQRYPADYDGILSLTPLVDFSSLMLAPVWIRIRERPVANWVTPAKANAIHGEIIRQCDELDGLADGIINNYMACRRIFDVTQGPPNRDPWEARRCPDNVDPDPADTTSSACLTDGQIATLSFGFSPYQFATPLANGRRAFGMWLPNTGLSEWEMQMAALYHFEHLAGTRYKGQEGAADDAPMFSHIGAAGVSGFLMQDLNANPLDYVEGGALDERRRQISPWLDATDPDLTSFHQRGGKLIVMVGTNDNMASPADQLDYFQSVIDTMGQTRVDAFARFFVVPHADHFLAGQNYPVDGDGKRVPAAAIPTPTLLQQWDWLVNWVEHDVAPETPPIVSAGDKSLPLCSYPMYPVYVGGPAGLASSYRCAQR